MSLRVRKDKKALEEANDALASLDTSIELGEHGDIKGMDDVDLGLEALASALAKLFIFPDAGEDVAPDIDEVLSYLASEGEVDPALVGLARDLADMMHRAGYEPLLEEECWEAESARSELYNELSDLVRRIEEEIAE